MRKYLAFISFVFVFLTLNAKAEYCAANHPDVQEYIEHLVNKYDFEREKLENLFCTVTFNEEVVTKLSKPAEAMPWFEYKKLLITPERITKGIAYWQEHEKTLALAEKKYGVPASIIIAIIGIETKYGENKGTYPVFNTLVTLSFNHGRRANFFRSELTQYLLLARENNFKPLLLKGSYAGAVGLPQFMPSSYRQYAVDFNDKGFSDLFNNHADAIASVCNYLKKHGWQTGETVAILATFQGNDPSALIRKNYKPYYTQAELEKGNVKPTKSLNGKKASFIRLKDENNDEYWLGLQNFYVISTYNNSELYVMAVDVLAQKLRETKYHKVDKKESTAKPLIKHAQTSEPIEEL